MKNDRELYVKLQYGGATMSLSHIDWRMWVGVTLFILLFLSFIPWSAVKPRNEHVVVMEFFEEPSQIPEQVVTRHPEPPPEPPESEEVVRVEQPKAAASPFHLVARGPKSSTPALQRLQSGPPASSGTPVRIREFKRDAPPLMRELGQIRRPIADVPREIPPVSSGPGITTRHRGDFELPPASPQRVERSTGQIGGSGPAVGPPGSSLYNPSKGGGGVGGGSGLSSGRFGRGSGSGASDSLGRGDGTGGGPGGSGLGGGLGGYETIGNLKFSDFDPAGSFERVLGDIARIDRSLTQSSTQTYAIGAMRVTLKPNGIHGVQAELPEGLIFVITFRGNGSIREIAMFAKPGVSRPRDYILHDKIIATIVAIANSLRW